ncbi:MAG TPA: hypothetical protein VEA99_05775 [Gemmatimonadaceae bacterium]|nr:hypothetical protein [Gemmatimonadaceae bacterium]
MPPDVRAPIPSRDVASTEVAIDVVEVARRYAVGAGGNLSDDSRDWSTEELRSFIGAYWQLTGGALVEYLGLLARLSDLPRCRVRGLAVEDLGFSPANAARICSLKGNVFWLLLRMDAARRMPGFLESLVPPHLVLYELESVIDDLELPDRLRRALLLSAMSTAPGQLVSWLLRDGKDAGPRTGLLRLLKSEDFAVALMSNSAEVRASAILLLGYLK